MQVTRFSFFSLSIRPEPVYWRDPHQAVTETERRTQIPSIDALRMNTCVLRTCLEARDRCRSGGWADNDGVNVEKHADSWTKPHLYVRPLFVALSYEPWLRLFGSRQWIEATPVVNWLPVTHTVTNDLFFFFFLQLILQHDELSLRWTFFLSLEKCYF